MPSIISRLQIRTKLTLLLLVFGLLPLGAHDKTVYKTRVVPFKAEDALFLYSDALIETPNKRGDVFTPKMMESALIAKNPQTSFKTILEKFKAHCNEVIGDDLTVLLLSRQTKP